MKFYISFADCTDSDLIKTVYMLKNLKKLNVAHMSRRVPADIFFFFF